MLNIINNMWRKRLIKVSANDIERVKCGNKYGGFEIIPDKLMGGVVYSFGIGEDLSFSEYIIKNFGVEVYAFDPTPKSIAYVNNNDLKKNRKFTFFPWGISDIDGKENFHLPVNADYVSGSVIEYEGVKAEAIEVPMKRLKTIMAELGHSGIDLLKLDVEGAEFKVITDILKAKIPVKQICVEVHERFFPEKTGKKLLKKMMCELKAEGYVLVAISDQNGEELTFIKKEVI